MSPSNEVAQSLRLEQSHFHGIPCEIIHFEFNGFVYFISFTLVSDEYGSNTAETLHELLCKDGQNPHFAYQPNSYKIDFDVKETFLHQNGERAFTAPRKIKAFQNLFALGQAKIVQSNTIKGFAKSGLGELLLQFLLYHCENHHAQCYYFTASRKGLKKFYDYLIDQYAAAIHFQSCHLDDKGTVYEIRTHHYDTPRIENPTNG